MHYLMPKAEVIAKLKSKIQILKEEDKNSAKKLERLLARVKHSPEVAII
ncbi:MAG: hypothetical protein GX780_04190 [Campylobacteraceae bacterium]|nr:hypothetical protein [Campylobacteraceae bacterium]